MGLRWAVSLRATEKLPHFESLYRRSLQCLPIDDVTKQARFHFRDDALACVLARILIRSAAVEVLGVPWHSIDISRGDRGKPLLSQGGFQFNVSHQGDMVVLASSARREIGVDVMRVNEERDATATQHIARMSKLFIDDELRWMNSQPGENKKWTSFYRVWCLKEAVLKATGRGLVNDLKTIGFHVNGKEVHEPGCFLTSTGWSECNIPQTNWVFEESFVNEEHCVAVGKIYPSASEAAAARSQIEAKPRPFEMTSLDQLLQPSSPVNTEEDGCQLYDDYTAKPWKDGPREL